MASNTSQLFPTHAGGREFGDFGWSCNGLKADVENLHRQFTNWGFSSGAPAGSPAFSASMNGLGMNEYLESNMAIQRQPLVSEQTEGDDFFGSMEELESHALGTLLPDADEDDEFDFFNSGGGMELESDLQSQSDGHGNSNYVGNVLAGEHPYGEHPSRTLFVRNINSNVEDTELRALFEQYGAIRTLYTACKHRGFVMISYYDIRAARSAMRGLQNKPLRRRKLDIHFSIPKDNPSDKDVNQGTLVVFNLDASVTNDDLRQIFGIYGEIKEIRETPHKKHHKFIEFYDVRAAEAALRALNRSDIAGKRIKLEPSRPGGARRSLMQQLTHELEQEEFRCQQLQGPPGTSPAGHSPQWGSFINQHNDSAMRGPFGSFASKHPNGVGSLPSRLQASSNIDRSSANFLRQKVPSLQIADQDPVLAFYDELDAHCSMQAMDNSSRVHMSTRNGEHSFWNISSPFHSKVQNYLGNRYTRTNIDVPAGLVDRTVVDGQNGFLADLPDMSWAGPFGSLNLKGSNHVLGGLAQSMVDSSRLAPLYRAGPFANGVGSLDNFSDRCQNRGEITGLTDKKYQLDLDRILLGQDLRTTLMIKNIPNKYTSKLLLSTIDEHHRGTYDFIYLPIDFKNKCNVGYAFINMTEPAHIVPFFKTFDGKKWEKFNSEKVATLAYARIQGKAALVAHFQNSSLMNEDKRCRPILFGSEGDPEPFCAAARPEIERNYQFEISSL